MPDELTPDSFMAQQGSAAQPAADLTPDSFMASQVAPETHNAPAASWWDKTKALTEVAAPAVYHKAQELMNAPLVPEWITTGLPSIKPPAAGETGPSQLEPWKPESVGGAVAHSAAEFARGMTSPENIGIGALMGPLGKITPLLSRAVSAGFGVQLLKSAYDQYPEIRDAIAKKDWPRAAGAITTAVLSGGLGVAAGAHAVRGGEVPPSEPEPELPKTPIERATESARAGVEALTPDTFMQDAEAGNAPAAETPSVDTLTPPAIAQPAEQAAQTIVGGPDEFMATAPQPPVTPGVQPEGQAAVDATPSTPREPSTPPALGRDATVLVPGETTSYPVRYAVRELADLQPSHNPFNFEPNPNYDYTNDRDYSRTGNAARVVQQSSPDTFNPEYPTSDSPTAEHGAPIIDASGNVLGGNSRTMTLARVYQRGGPDAEMYRNAIADKAAQFGLDPVELDRFEQPVLVRELGGGVDAQRAITDFNKAAAAELSPEERAVSDGRRLSDQTVQEIAGRIGDVGEDGTLADALRGDNGADVVNALVRDGVLTPQEAGGYVDDRGNLTPEAKSRVAKALVGRLFETPAEFRETTPSMRAKLERVAPQLLRVEGQPDWNLTDATRQAIALSEDARIHKMPIEDAARQTVVGPERSYSPEAIALAKTLEQGPVNAAAAFRRYANDAALSREGSQGAFFTPPTRMEAFTDAFRPMVRSSERGGINPDLLSLGAGKFVQEDVIPAAKRVAGDLVEAKDDIMRVVAPQTRGSAAEFTGLQLRQRMAQFARRFDQGEQRLRDARRFFNTRAPEANYRFIDNVERGLGRESKPGDAELEPIARMFSKMLDQRRSEVQALGEGALKGFYQNYFPHIFEKPEQASKFVDSFFGGKRSMEGPKSFLKHRDFPTFREALDAGLKPVSDNPVDLVMMKAREMDRYLLAHAVLRDLAENGLAKGVAGQKDENVSGQLRLKPEWEVQKREDLPPDFVSIRDPVGGGKWYASEGAADVLNNFLSPGLRGRSGLFRTLLGVNNVMNQANLGLSAFHLRAVSISSIAGRMGLGVIKAMEGHPLDAALHIVSSPAAPFIDFVKGSKMLHDWFKPGSEGAPIAAMTNALMKGGGRARMDAFYPNEMADKMMTAFRRGNFIGGALRSPFAAIETMSKPLMNYLVPRMKLGAFADMAQHEIEKLGPGAKVADVQRAMSAAWDHVENRLGQMTYDNRFWNRAFKDIAMLTVRSVGWNLGDFLEGKSAIGAAKQVATLKRPEDLHGLGFVVGYTMTAALMGAIMQYLHTGKGPQELEDYFFPKREDGRRVVAAPYVKDAYQFVKDPARTIENKASPLISTMSQMFNNRDYYDHPIRNVDAPLVKQLQQEAEYVGRQFLPFTLQPYAGNPQKRPRALPGGDTTEHKVENFLGVTPAPAALQPVERNSKGRIARSSAAMRAFREDHPCPSTGSTRGPCPGYVVDHFRALKHGGDDSPSNMQWQKTADAMLKDRRE